MAIAPTDLIVSCALARCAPARTPAIVEAAHALARPDRFGTALAMPPGMATPEPKTAREARDASVSDLVTGIVSDTGDLLGAHVDSIRNEIQEGLADVRDRIIATVIAAAVGIAAAVIVSLALGLTLIRAGLPAWAAFWIIGGALLVAGLALFVRARRHSVDADPGRALRRAKNDATWLADRAGDAVS